MNSIEQLVIDLTAACFYWRQASRAGSDCLAVPHEPHEDGLCCTCNAAREAAESEESLYRDKVDQYLGGMIDVSQASIIETIIINAAARVCAEAWLISHPEWVEGDFLEVFAFGEFADGARPSVTLRPLRLVP